MTARSTALVTAAVCALLAAPRVVRLWYPQIWIEDESYLTGALMLSHGFMPYRDFPLPHYPVLEAMLAVVFRMAHASLRTAEATTQIAAFGGSLLVLALGRRLDGLLTGAVAALIFATSGLLFRYHLFEREVFVVVPVLAAALLACRAKASAESPDRATARSAKARSATASAERPDRATDRSAKALAERPGLIGVLLFLALTIKLTAIYGVAAIGIQLWRQTGRRAALAAVGTTIALLAALTVALTAAFGTDFLVQVFLFRAVHAEFPSLMVKLTEMRLTLDISLALGTAGVALIIWTRRAQQWIGPLLQLAAGCLVLVLLNPTYWAHTGIELLPWLSLCGGFLVAGTVRALRRPSGRGAGADRVSAGRAYVCAAAAVGLLIAVTPLRNLNWEAGDGSTYGFGYRDRAEIEKIAADVSAHTDAQTLVAAPPIIAFAADRRELVPYPEIAGTIDELTEAVRRRGYAAALEDPDLRNGSFWDAVDASRERIEPQILSAVKDRRLGVVINDSPDDLMPVPFVRVSQASLEAAGYQIEAAFAHYDVWLRR